MVSFWRQYRYLLWKGFIVKKRQPLWLLAELFVPVLFFIIIAIVRSEASGTLRNLHPECHYQSKAFPSAGFQPFMQSLTCDFLNDCSNSSNDNETEYLTRYANPGFVHKFLSTATEQLSSFGQNVNLSETLFFRLLSFQKSLAKLNVSALSQADVQQGAMVAFGDKEWLLDELGILRKEADDDDIARSLGPSSEEALNQSTEVGESLKSLFELSTKLPFADNFGQLLQLAGAEREDQIRTLFCGKSSSDLINDSGLKPKTPALSNTYQIIQKELSEFLSKIVSRTQGSSSATSCGDIVLGDAGKCNFLDNELFKPLRALLQGYVLVTPKTNETREIVKKLNESMKTVAYFLHRTKQLPDIVKNFRLVTKDTETETAALNVAELLRTKFPRRKRSLQKLTYAIEMVYRDNDTEFMEWLAEFNATIYNNSECFRVDRFRFVDTEEQMQSTASCLGQRERYFTGIVFDVGEDVVSYKIRHNSKYVEGTAVVTDQPSEKLSRRIPFLHLKYIQYGFVFVQEAIDNAIIYLKTGVNLAVGTYAQQEPYPCVLDDTFDIGKFIGFVYVISFVLPCSLLVKNIVYEKEMRLKEQMRIMGLGDLVHFVSWATISWIFTVFNVAAIILIVQLGNVMTHVDTSVLIVILLSHGVALITQSVLLSTFFSNANISTAASTLASFLFYLPFQVSWQVESRWFTLATLAFPQSTMAYMAWMLASATEDDPITFSNIRDTRLLRFDISLDECLIAYFFHIAFSLILSWYLSAIAPGVYGVSEPFYFFLTKRYWFPKSIRSAKGVNSDPNITGKATCEEHNDETNMAVNITNMSKVYDSGTRALDNLNLKMYESQITSLLGHNGAGKTTAMSILSGLYSPSSGTALIYGMDIRYDLAGIRKILGICPQYNILFASLSVAEHLRFFAALKGVPDNKIPEEIESILKSVSLSEKATALAGTLSGGMKRRLSIAIALIGGSKFVILDEPTAGVDVNMRKDIWTLLQKNKIGRTILLSTHHMDEADVLSDRIAILSEGQLVTVGSSVFLKNRYGKALQLVICKKEPLTSYNNEVHQLISNSNIQLQFRDENDSEIVFGIPMNVDSKQLEEFFLSLDKKLEALRLGSYGITPPTLQQIFVSLAPQREYRVPKVKGVFGKLLAKILRRKDEKKITEIERLVHTNSVLAVDNTSVEKSKSKSKSLKSQTTRDVKTDDETNRNNTSGTQTGSNNAPARLEAGVDTTEEQQKRSQDEVPLNTKTKITSEEATPVAATKRTSGTTDKSATADDFFKDLDVPTLPSKSWRKTLNHIRALVTCRFHYNRRNHKTLMFEIYFPIVLLAMCEFWGTSVFGGTATLTVDQPVLPLVTSLLGDDMDTYLQPWRWNDSNYKSHALTDALVKPPALGVRCVNNIPDMYSYFEKIKPDRMEQKLGVMKERKSEKFFTWGNCHKDSKSSFNWTQEEKNYYADVECSCLPDHGANCTSEMYPYSDLARYRLQSRDQVWDLRNRSIAQLRLVTRWPNIHDGAFKPSFYGGLSLGHQNSYHRNASEQGDGFKRFQEGFKKFALSSKWIKDINAALDLQSLIDDNQPSDVNVSTLLPQMNTVDNVKVWFNDKLYHSLPTYVNVLSNAKLRMAANRTDASNIGILTFNHPMNQSSDTNIDSNKLELVILFRINVLIVTLSIIPAGFVIFLVEDRVSDCYHLQIVSGLKKSTYWLTGFAFDLTVYLLCTFIISLIYWCFDVKEFCGAWNRFLCFYFLMFIYGVATIIWNYVLQAYFSIASLAFMVIAIGTFFAGVLLYLTVFLLELVIPGHFFIEVLSFLFMISPQYCFCRAVLRATTVYQIGDVAEQFLMQLNRMDLRSELPIPELLDYKVMGIYCGALSVHIVVAATILYLIVRKPLKFFQLLENRKTAMLMDDEKAEIDEDVAADIERVQQIKRNDSQYALVARNIAKTYNGKNLVVRGVSVGVVRGECFGLLGLNGAGKTTTFGMLTSKLYCGFGSIEVYGCSVTDGDDSVYDQLGYCPQFDALNMRLSTKENLVFFARLRGVPEYFIDKLATLLLQALHLRPYAKTLTSDLSGGNRRKLSVAIAIVNQPPLVFLDEPSAGMDPGSQQFLWKVINRIRRSGKAVVLTSHSMEECEALCTRIAIMDKGKIRCLGSKQHLKNKFGEGYSLTIKVYKPDDSQAAAKFVMSRIGCARLEAVHFTTVFLHFSREFTSIAQILHVINELKESMQIEDFALSQATLTDVFQSLSANYEVNKIPVVPITVATNAAISKDTTVEAK